MPKKSPSFFIKTFGCQMNFSDSERIFTLLTNSGFKEARNENEADLIIFNTCGVRQTAEDRALGQVHNFRKKNERLIIVITGCLANRKDVQKKLEKKADIFLPIDKIGQLPKKLEILRNQKKSDFEERGSEIVNFTDYLNIIPQYQNENSALVPIMTGCNNFCSYCVVPYARGPEKSRSAEKIVTEIEQLAKNGYTEILLLGQNVNSYCDEKRSQSEDLLIKSSKLSTTFPVLLDGLAKKFPNILFKFLTSHPKDFSDQLIAVIKNNENISKEIHLPIQSGSNKILKAMNRPYTQQDFLSSITKIKKSIPIAKISTDVIIGFPGETEEDFSETVKVFKVVDFSEAFLNKYSPRPGTPALSLGDPISWEEKKNREKILRACLKS